LDSHPGVLIVVRFKERADKMAQWINDHAGRTVARSYHTDNKVTKVEGNTADVLSRWPVLVITHRAYEIGLDAVNRGEDFKSNWNAFHAWSDGSRKLIVIDEALNMIEEAQIDINRLRRALGAIPWHIAEGEEFKREFTAINSLLRMLMGAANAKLSDQDTLL